MTTEPQAAPTAPAYTPRSMKVVVAAAVAALALTALDLGTKTWAEENLASVRRGDPPALCVADEDGFIRTQRLRGLPVVLIEDVLDLEYAENCGAAFGLLRGAPDVVRIVVFGTAALMALTGLFWMLVTGRGGRWFAYAVPFVVAGALGNLADRIRYGYVIDFIHAHWGEAFDYPTFNVADIAITIGVVCWLIDAFVIERAEAASRRDARPQERTEPTA